MWPAPSHSTSCGAGDAARRILRLCPIEVSLSSVPQMIVVGTARTALRCVELVERRRSSGRTPRARRTASPASISSRNSTYACGHVRRRTRTGRATRKPMFEPEPAQPRRPARGGPGQRRRPAAARPARRRRRAASGTNDPVRSQPAGGGRDQGDAGDPVAEQLGVLLGERDDRHAAHRVADQDDRPFGDHARRSPARGRRRAGRWWRARGRSGRSARASAGRRTPSGACRGSAARWKCQQSRLSA